ncbi:MAG: hypothetical protein Q8Q09_11265 [Deltaproteobacteria bacterium]|nr:hypothetical protein [Deltaproteobacteria bacterium]
MHELLLKSSNEVAMLLVSLYGDLSVPRELCQLTPLRALWRQSDDLNVKHVASWVNALDPVLGLHVAQEEFAGATTELGWLGASPSSAQLYNPMLKLMNAGGRLAVVSDFSAQTLEGIAQVAGRFVDAAVPLVTPVDSKQPGMMLRSMASFEAGMFLIALCRADHGAFERLMQVLMPVIAESAAKYRKDTRHGNPPHGFAGVFAALALAPSLSPECETALLKLAGKKNVTPMALFTLYRHGHAASVARLASSNDFAALRGLLDFDQHLVTPLYFASPAGADWLRDEMINEGRWHEQTISAACALGIWNDDAKAAWLVAVARGDNAAIALLDAVPALTDDEYTRVRAALPELGRAALELSHPRPTLEAARNLMKEVARFAVPIVKAVGRARAMSVHFGALRDDYPTDLRVLLTLEMASTPALPHRTPNENTHLAHLVRLLEPRWLPERGAEIAPRAAPKRKSKP